MPKITISDSKDHVLDIAIQPTDGSALPKYVKSARIDLSVPDNVVAMLNGPLSVAAPKPIQAQATVNAEFQLGSTKAEIDVQPRAQWMLGINATPGSNLFEGDPFPVAAKVPDGRLTSRPLFKVRLISASVAPLAI